MGVINTEDVSQFNRQLLKKLEPDWNVVNPVGPVAVELIRGYRAAARRSSGKVGMAPFWVQT